MQMDTLSRRLQSLKVDMASIISSSGQGGLTQFFKEQVSSIDAFVMGLQKISPETLSAVGSLAKLAITLTAVNAVLKRFITAETVATVANLAVKIRETTTATEGLALAMKALGRSGPMIALTLALTAGLYAIESYTNALGEEDQKEKESIATKQDQIALAGQQIETLQKQKEFSESMYGAYVKLDGIVKTSTEGSDKYNNALKNRGTTETELRKVMGDAAVDAIRDAGWTKEAYEKEAQSFTDAIEAKKQAAGEFRKEMITSLENQKAVIETQIDEYWQDAKNFNDSIASKINALGIWKTIQDEYYREQADIASKQKSASEKALADTTKDVEDNPGNDIIKRRQEMAQQELEGASYNLDYYNQKIINTEEGPLNKLKLQQAEIDKKIAETKLAGLPDFKGISSGGTEVDTTAKKGKAGKSMPTDQTEQIEQKLSKAGYNAIVDANTISNNKFSESLSRIADMANRLGSSYDLLDSKLGSYQGKIASLTDTSKKLKDQVDKDIAKLNELASGGNISITTTSGGGSNEAIAMNFLMQQGYTPEQSSAIVGNLMTESGMQPNIYAHDGSGSYGIGQWTGGRRDALNEFAQNNNSDVTALETQLAFLVEEMKTTESGSISKFLNSGSTTPEQFAYAFAKYYERPAEPANPDRQKNARDIMGQYESGNLGGQQIEVSVTIPEEVLAAKGMNKAQWSGMSTDSKKEFIDQNKEQIANAKVITAYLNQISEEEKKSSEIQKQITEAKQKEYEETIKGIKEVADYQTKQSDLITRMQNAMQGISGNEGTKAVSTQSGLERQVAISDAEINQYRKKGIDIFTNPTANEERVKNLELKNQLEQQSAFTTPETNYKQTMSGLDYQKSMNKLKNPTQSIPDENANHMADIDYYTKKVAALNTLMAEARKNSIFAEDTDKYKEFKLQLAQTQKDLQDAINEPTKKMKESAESVFDSILLKGEDFHKTFKKLWEQLAEEALKAMLGIQSGSTSLFGQLLGNKGGWFGGNKGQSGSSSSGSNIASIASSLMPNIDSFGKTSTSKSGYSFGSANLLDSISGSGQSAAAQEAMKKKMMANSSSGSGGSSFGSYFGLLQNAGKMFGWFANGGETDGPSIAGEDGKEVVVPVEKNTQNSVALLNHAANKLGVSSFGKQLVPNISSKAQDSSNKMINQNTNSMEQTNKILATQNTILTKILNKNAESGSQPGSIAVLNNQQSDGDLYSQMQRMQNKGYNVLGSNS